MQLTDIFQVRGEVGGEDEVENLPCMVTTMFVQYKS